MSAKTTNMLIRHFASYRNRAAIMRQGGVKIYPTIYELAADMCSAALDRNYVGDARKGADE